MLIVGAGGLGASAALYLAGAGVGKIISSDLSEVICLEGRLGIIDYDSVEINNLHRQIIHSEKSVGIAKAISARDAVLRFNSSCDCIAYDVEFNSTNSLEIMKPYPYIALHYYFILIPNFVLTC